ncbi:MAG: methylated-DNA--[protein]-cysteine S-methyltransferase [Bacteroidota bacterium]
MANKIFIKELKTDYGELLLGDYNEQLCLCDWKYRRMRTAIDSRIQEGLQSEYVVETTAFHEEVTNQLEAYFEGKLKTFDLPLKAVGSAFQQSVWEALQQIPFGSRETYLGLSRKLGNEKAIRAVASANGANAISILVPCHRVVGSNGDLTGYAGGLSAKRKLLKMEEKVVGVGQLDIFEK